jgi:D-alanyl-D-alanine carboxypeptidase (penicillin-binding protein 5/6)
MNKKAKELNLKHTHFITPHGLDEDEHYTTAYELALIADYALNIEKISEVVGTKVYNVNINGNTKTITNTNELLGYLEGVNGVKTGFTNGAGRCLVTSVERNGFNIITVVLGANTKKIRTRDSINLIEYIYKNYELVKLEELINKEFLEWNRINSNRIVVNKGIKKELKIGLSNMQYKFYPLNQEEINNIKISISSLKYLEAPVEVNTKIGEIKVQNGEKNICNIDIITKNRIDKKSAKYYFMELIGKFKDFEVIK